MMLACVMFRSRQVQEYLAIVPSVAELVLWQHLLHVLVGAD